MCAVYFKDVYADSFIVIPYLFFAPLVQMLFQIVAGQFEIIKKSWANLLFLISGAFCNVCFNYFLIPLAGIEGAAISTVIGYFVTLLLCMLFCIKIKKLYVKRKLFVLTIVVCIYFMTWRFNTNNNLISFSTGIIALGIIFFLYQAEIRTFFSVKRK